jgi:hypothetical protein
MSQNPLFASEPWNIADWILAVKGEEPFRIDPLR